MGNISQYMPVISVVLSAVVVMLGWFTAHHFAVARDHANKLREIRLEYLISAYRQLGDATQRKPNSEEFRRLEAVFHDVQLFGSTEQLEIFNSMHN